MERERLARLLEEPGRMAREDLAGLKALAEKYPWFSGAQLLRTAGERISGDVLFDETLRTTSAHLPSRAVLYDLTTAPEPYVARLHVVKPEPDVLVEALPLKNPLVSEVLPPIAVEELVPVNTPEPLEPLAGPEFPAPTHDETVPANEPKADDGLTEELNEQIIRAAMVGAYDLTLREQLPPASERELPTAPVVEKALPSAPEPMAFVAPDARLRFTDWLSAADVPEPIASSPLPTTEPLEQLDTEALIDRFIEQANPAPVQRNPFFTPQEAGKRSMDDTVGLVTETLARIYVKQGNLQKAIATYGRLALKHPEKGAYFAALQKELEEQLNK